MNIAPLKAHEMSPSILDLTLNPNTVELKIRFSVEAMLAEVDLSEISDTNLSKNAEKYDELRSFTSEQINDIFKDKWPEFEKYITLNQSGRGVKLNYQELTVPGVGNTELTRISHLLLEGKLQNNEPVVFSWNPKLGPIVVRQLGVENGLTQFLADGDVSDLIFFEGLLQKNKISSSYEYEIQQRSRKM